MTNTIPNVPRELLEAALSHPKTPEEMLSKIKAAEELRALLSAPSPAGVDGLETIGYATESELAQLLDPTMPTGKYVRIGLDHPTCWKEDAPYEHLVAICVLSDATAIIDGLRGENERIRLNIAEYNESIACYQSERDQQAQRIGEMEGLLLRVQVSLSLDDTEWGYSGAEKYKLLADIRAALSAGKEGE